MTKTIISLGIICILLLSGCDLYTSEYVISYESCNQICNKSNLGTSWDTLGNCACKKTMFKNESEMLSYNYEEDFIVTSSSIKSKDKD